MYEDQNGETLTEGALVFALGTVVEVTETTATVSLTKFGTPASLVFLRTEPVKATFDPEDSSMNGVITGDMVDELDEVMIVGTITSLAPGIHDVANVNVQKMGEAGELTFFCAELITATLNRDTQAIKGDLDRPTKAQE